MTENDTIVDYTKLDEKIRNTIKAIESKPHVRYIRYLLTKRYAPMTIKRELFRLGLSAPHEPNLTAYYIAVIDPLVRKYNLGHIYGDFKNKLLRKNQRGAFAKDILNYSLHMCDDLDGQVRFCNFIKELEIDTLWVPEIYRFHGSTERMPTDETTGKRVLDVTSPKRIVEKILVHPKRYLVDKLILENIPDSRIAAYCKEQLKLPIYEYDVVFYKKVFFNIKTHAIEDKIKALEIEKNSLNTLLTDIDNLEVYNDMELGEKTVIKKQAEQRVSELADNIKTMNMIYSEFAFRTAVDEQTDFEKMFTDIVARGYKRFCDLDNYKDRDVVDPMFKVARIMTFAHDKVENIQNLGDGKSGIGVTDKHSQATLMELYKKRTDEIMSEQLKRANHELAEAGIEPIPEEIAPEDIAGIEDLGVCFEIKDDEGDK